jgi:hypothetical protein
MWSPVFATFASWALSPPRRLTRFATRTTTPLSARKRDVLA